MIVQRCMLEKSAAETPDVLSSFGLSQRLNLQLLLIPGLLSEISAAFSTVQLLRTAVKLQTETCTWSQKLF